MKLPPEKRFAMPATRLASRERRRPARAPPEHGSSHRRGWRGWPCRPKSPRRHALPAAALAHGPLKARSGPNDARRERALRVRLENVGEIAGKLLVIERGGRLGPQPLAGQPALRQHLVEHRRLDLGDRPAGPARSVLHVVRDRDDLLQDRQPRAQQVERGRIAGGGAQVEQAQQTAEPPKRLGRRRIANRREHARHPRQRPEVIGTDVVHRPRAAAAAERPRATPRISRCSPSPGWRRSGGRIPHCGSRPSSAPRPSAS